MTGALHKLCKLPTLEGAGLKRDDAAAAGLRAGVPQEMLSKYDRARGSKRRGPVIQGDRSTPH